MHDSYEEGEDYDDEHYDYDHPSLNPYAYYYKFDVGPDHPISKWIQDMLNSFFDSANNSKIENSQSFPVKKFPVNSWNPDTESPKKLQYLGSNYFGEPIWKSKYWVIRPLDLEYKLHLENHAAHFVLQPKYYRGMFDILN